MATAFGSNDECGMKVPYIRASFCGRVWGSSGPIVTTARIPSSTTAFADAWNTENHSPDRPVVVPLTATSGLTSDCSHGDIQTSSGRVGRTLPAYTRLGGYAVAVIECAAAQHDNPVCPVLP